MKEFIGALVDSGYSPTEIREMMGPYVAEMDDDWDLGSHVQDVSGRETALREILQKAQDDRQPPGPQVVVGAVSPTTKADAKLIRVDTEKSFVDFSQSASDPDINADIIRADSDIDDVEDDDEMVEKLSARAQAELLGDFERGYASQWMLGRSRHRSRVGDILNMNPASRSYDAGQLIGNVMDLNPASYTALQNDPAVSFSRDQTCLFCGRESGAAVCPPCGQNPVVIGLFERGYASQHIVGMYDYGDNRRHMLGLFERGAAASLYDDNPSATIGSEFYRLPMHERQYEGGSAIFEDLHALSAVSDVREPISLSFNRPDMSKHITTWKQGPHIYGSIRVTGWDGHPRVLTAATPYAKEVGVVVGYANSAAIAPAQTLAVLDPLARQLGASRLLPRLAAAAPAVLRIAHDKAAPLVMTSLPAGADVHSSWV